ncbi:MAG: PIG-L family deacetylase [Epsilonproteobacteria bacterium]|nr:PIG-L family deacetylase [Campylobacterota bacterium]
MKILIIAAHPDDEVLGCFATVSRMIKEGHEAYTLILGEGKTSRGEGYEELQKLRNETMLANKSIGISDVFLEKFPDNKFDTVALLEIVKSIEVYIDKIKPDIVFTHYENDLNVDHRVTYKAAITATRPMKGCSVKEIYSFEVLSSTEWNYPLSFSPDVFFDVSHTIDDKIKAMGYYKSELRDFPHPRSLYGIELNAKQWGMKVGVEYAEAFKCIRIVK